MAYTLNYSYIDIDDAYTVAGYTGTPVDVVIPSTHEGKPVISISDTAFFYCNSLTSITIPDSVTSIGSNAFLACSGLISINASEDNDYYKSIDGNLYSKDGKALIQYAIGKTATEFTIPDSVTSIGNSAFSRCSSLTSVTIGNGVTSIGRSAFSNCSSLKSVTIPNNVVTSIEAYVFQYCSGLTSITIPDSVTSIGYSAFSGCSSLTSITIPDGVTSIGQYAFSDCSSLTNVTIPDSVTSIGQYAFSGCSSLTSINLLPTLVPSLGGFVFYGINQNAKFYCFQSAIGNYKSATDWNTYADKFVVDDIRLYFVMNSISAKNYFTTKISDKADKVIGATNGNFARLNASGNLTDSGKKASDFMPAIKTITIALNQITGSGNDAYTTAQYIRFVPTAEQYDILLDETIQVIKLDLTALGNSAPAPYVWLRRNTVIALPNPLDPSSTISAYQFTCGGEQFWYENYQTDIAIKNIGNAALVYAPALGFVDITLLNISVPNLYSSLGQIPKYQHNITVNTGVSIIKFSLRSASLDPITYIELKNKKEYYTSILLYSIVLMTNNIPAVISSISWDFASSNDMTIVVNGSNSYVDMAIIQENSTITDIVTQL